MLDNPDRYGIYPTSEFMGKMEDYIISFKRERDEARKLNEKERVEDQAYDRTVLSPDTGGCSCHINPPCSFCVDGAGSDEVSL